MPAVLEQAGLGPTMVDTTGGEATVMVKLLAVALKPQLFPAFTVTFPLPPVAGGVPVMEVVDELPVQPVGNDHWYSVAPVTGDML